MNQMGNTVGPMPPGAMHAGPMTQINMQVSNPMNVAVNPSVANVSVAAPGPLMNTSSMNPMISPVSVSNQMNLPNQMSNSMSGPMLGPMGNVMSNQMSSGQMPPALAGGMSHNQMSMHMAQRKVSMFLFYS